MSERESWAFGDDGIRIDSSREQRELKKDSRGRRCTLMRGPYQSKVCSRRLEWLHSCPSRILRGFERAWVEERRISIPFVYESANMQARKRGRQKRSKFTFHNKWLEQAVPLGGMVDNPIEKQRRKYVYM